MADSISSASSATVTRNLVHAVTTTVALINNAGHHTTPATRYSSPHPISDTASA